MECKGPVSTRMPFRVFHFIGRRLRSGMRASDRLESVQALSPRFLVPARSKECETRSRNDLIDNRPAAQAGRVSSALARLGGTTKPARSSPELLSIAHSHSRHRGDNWSRSRRFQVQRPRHPCLALPHAAFRSNDFTSPLTYDLASMLTLMGLKTSSGTVPSRSQQSDAKLPQGVAGDSISPLLGPLRFLNFLKRGGR
jgi:hypothetical protein